jgi:parvulin-like peptidyl-prolyl isomerase
MAQRAEENILHSLKGISGDKSGAQQTPQEATRTVGRIGFRLSRGFRWGIGLFVVGLALGSVPGWLQSHAGFATINATRISRSDFQHRCELAAGSAVARQMVIEELQLQLAQKRGLLPTEQEIETKYQRQASQPDFAKNLAASHKTPSDIRRGLLLEMAQTNLITEGVTTTETDAQAYYQANTDPKNPHALYYQPDAVQVAVIVSDRPDDIKAALHALATGASFANVAARYSKDQSKTNNGLLPAIRRGQMDAKRFPGLEARLFAMKVNDQTDDVVVAGAHWIIRCVGRSEERRIPFEKVSEACEQAAKLQKGLQVNGETLKQNADAFEKAATITVAESSYQAAAQSH